MRVTFRHGVLAAALAAISLSGFAQEAASNPDTNEAAAAAGISLPELNAADWFTGKMGGTFGKPTVTIFPKNNKIAIGGFRVVYVTHNEASAFVRATYLPGGVETGSAKSKTEVDLVGVDDATLQTITDNAYRTFIEQLKAAGREVVTMEELQGSYTDFKLLPSSPQPVNLGKLEGKAFSPTGTSLWWQVGDSWGDAGLSQKNMRAFNKLAKDSGAIAIAPMIVIDFAHMSSSGNHSGLVRKRAETGASLAMSIQAFTTRVVRAEELRYGNLVFKGDDGALTLAKRLDTDIEFATLYKKGEQNSKILSLIGPDHKRAKQWQIAETSNEAYSVAASVVLNKATGTFAKLIAENKPAM